MTEVTYKRDRGAVKINIPAMCRNLSNVSKIEWNDNQIRKARKIITERFLEFIKNHICVDVKKAQVIESLIEEVKSDDDAWLCDLIQCADIMKCPTAKHKKVAR